MDAGQNWCQMLFSMNHFHKIPWVDTSTWGLWHTLTQFRWLIEFDSEPVFRPDLQSASFDSAQHVILQGPGRPGNTGSSPAWTPCAGNGGCRWPRPRCALEAQIASCSSGAAAANTRPGSSPITCPTVLEESAIQWHLQMHLKDLVFYIKHHQTFVVMDIFEFNFGHFGRWLQVFGAEILGLHSAGMYWRDALFNEPFEIFQGSTMAGTKPLVLVLEYLEPTVSSSWGWRQKNMPIDVRNCGSFRFVKPFGFCSVIKS